MAENKKSFILYVDLMHTVKHLTDEQAGRLFKHILSYCNDENPETDDLITNLAFEPIKVQLKRDLKKWENYIEKQKANGKKGGRPKTQKTQAFLEKPKKADNVNVNDINTNVFNGEKIDSYISELKTQTIFLDGMYMTYKLKPKSVGNIALKFKEHLKIFPKEHKDFTEFRDHLYSWVGFKVKKGELGEYLKHQIGEL